MSNSQLFLICIISSIFFHTLTIIYLDFEKEDDEIYVVSLSKFEEFSFSEPIINPPPLPERKVQKKITPLQKIDPIKKKSPEKKNKLINTQDTISVTQKPKVEEKTMDKEKSQKIQDLKIDHNCIILGSSWEKEEELVAEIVDEMEDIKWIIAPHEIDKKKLITLQSKFNVSCSLFSEIDYNKPIPRILIIDQIGLLADLYSFSEIAFIGGGFSGQLHNILEAGAKGNVILFGPKIEKHPEAKFLYEENVGYKINDSLALKTVIYELLNNKNTLRAKQKKVIEIINNQKGATKIIWNEIKKLI